MVCLVEQIDAAAARIAGDEAPDVIRHLQTAATVIEAHFSRMGGVEPEITIGTEPHTPEFRLVVAWMSGTGDDAEPTERVFHFTMGTIRELQRRMNGDVGVLLAEKAWNDLIAFDRSRCA